jgi:hypothetical protein
MENNNNSKSKPASADDESLSEDDWALIDMYAERVADLLLKCYFASKANQRK